MINDWVIKKFFVTVIAVQGAMLGLAVLSAVGVDIPFLRYVIGFIYLTFIPGFIILRIFRMHELGIVRTLLYAVGLSLVFNMYLGLIVNLLYPYLGITRPISSLPIFITWKVMLGILCIICYIRDKDFSVPIQLNPGNLASTPILLFALLPLLAILGTQLVNSYNANIALIVLIAIISLIPVLLVMTRFVPEQYYPFVVCMVSLSVLFHTALISNYLWGWDIRIEYFMYKVVEANNVWNSIVPPHAYNGILSITLLPAIYGFLLNMEGTWLFKIILPLFFSLVPLALYQVYQKQFGSKIAFLSVFFFMAVAPFFTMILEIGKQMVAEVFLALFFVVILDDKLGPGVKKLLVIIFGSAIIVAHYATAYLFMLVVLGAYILLLIIKRKTATMTITLSLLFIVLSLGWYMYSAGGVSFNSLANWSHNIYEGIGDLFLDPMSRYSLFVIVKERLPLHEILVYLYLLSQLCIALGFSVIFLNWIRKRDSSISDDFMCFSTVLFIFMVLSAVIPRLSGITDIPRSFHISLIVLAPFAVTGSAIIMRFAQTLLLKLKRSVVHPGRSLIYPNNNYFLLAFSLFLVPFFLFTTGFIYEVFDDPQPSSIAVSRDKTASTLYSECDVVSGRWLVDARGNKEIIYYDVQSHPFFQSYIGPDNNRIQRLNTASLADLIVTTGVPVGSYVYFREFNVRTGQLRLFLAQTSWSREGSVPVDLTALSFYRTIQESNRIYDNGGSLVYQTKTDYSPP